MIDEDELKFRRVKFEQVQNEIDTTLKGVSGKLGNRQVKIETESEKIGNISQDALKNLGKTNAP